MRATKFAPLAFAICGYLAIHGPLVGLTQEAAPAEKQGLEQLAGDWDYVEAIIAGRASPAGGRKVTIIGDEWVWSTPRAGTEPVRGLLKIKVDATQDPKHFDQTAPISNSTRRGIYKLEGDTLTLCFDRDINARPKEFSKDAAGVSWTVLKRTGPPTPFDAAAVLRAQRTLTPTMTPPANAPEYVKAYAEATRVTDPEKRIEALEKFLKDYATSPYALTAKRTLQQLVIRTHRDNRDKLLADIEKWLATETEDTKADALNNVAWELFLADALLDDAARFAEESLSLFEREKFAASERRTAEQRRLPAPSDEQLERLFAEKKSMKQDTLGQIYVKLGKTAEGEKLLKEAFAARPNMAVTAAALGALAQKRGENAVALDYLLTGVIGERPRPDAQGKLTGLFRQMYPDKSLEKDLEALLDDRYRQLYPTLHVPAYQPPQNRSDRVALAEVFTGSACPPCVAADLAFDAMLERYSRKDVIVLMYHQHIPGPDPMANPSTLARWKYYSDNRGVPSYLVDGERIQGGGGARASARMFYDRINPSIEKRLEAPAEAKLALTARLDGGQVRVKAEASQIQPAASDLRLNIALVEELLTYPGENGIRLHPVVVRSLAGENAAGIAVAASSPAPIEHTFDLAKISEELKAHLDDYESKAPGGRKFSQKKHVIDSANLAVVAFLQDQATKTILQAAHVRVTGEGVAANP